MRLLAILFTTLLPCAALASSLTGEYHGRIDGTDARLLIEDRNGQISGQYIEGSMTFQFNGRFDGSRLTATISLAQPAMDIAQVSGHLHGTGLRLDIDARNPQTGASRRAQGDFQRRDNGQASAPGNAPPAPGAGASGGEIDPRLVKVWRHEDLINSGGANFASFTTVLTMSLSANGRIEQYRESAGGGGDWSYDGGRTLVLAGQWYARDGILYVRPDGHADYVAATRYRRSDAYLVTEDANGRRIWR